MVLTQYRTAAVTSAISATRMGTYLNATGFGAGATSLDIYVWNALVSGAFFSVLHVCEVVVRNAIAHALELKYGPNWPWDPGFDRSLSKWSKNELLSAKQRTQIGSTGKVIAELKFAFWCQLFTARQDQHIWNAHLHTVFPLLPLPLTVAMGRKMLYDDMEALRGFRNRIAHHEPIFAYPLAEHHARIQRLVNLRCGDTQQWLAQWEIVSTTMGARP